jgi:hypothetical protein
MSILNQTPKNISAGDSAQWLVSIADYPASDGWTLKYKLINSTNQYDIVSIASDADHLINLLAATTNAYVAGQYELVAFVTKALERITLETGAFVIAPNLAGASTGIDSRSAAQKCLDALDTALATYGNKAYTQEYEIAGRRMKFTNLSDFMSARSKLQAEVARESARKSGINGIPFGPKVLVEFR